MKNEDTIILGGGLAGLSAAYHLKSGYVLFEKNSEIGGMARSIYKDGYIFDYDGHLLHFRNEYTFNLVSELLNGNLAPHKRNSWIYSKGIFTRYPFQANFYGLPNSVVKDCLMGLIKARFLSLSHLNSNGNFENWIIKTFGEGIANHFMLPYNRKFWTIEPKELTCEWLDGFVPVPDLEDTVTGAISDNTKPYGYNSRFWYPVKGGISELVNGFSDRIRNAHVNKKAVTIDQHRKEVVFEDVTIKKFKNMVTTMPLPELANILVDMPSDVKLAFSMLKWTSIYVLNIGIKSDNLTERHWVYYPEESVIFYRVGFPTSFSTDVAPEGRTSIYAEIAYSDAKKIDKDALVSRTIHDLKKCGIILEESDVKICLPIDIKYGYALYDSNRQHAVQVIKNYLEKFGIYTIGRYGSWKYMSMEDVILEGKKIAENISGAMEPTRAKARGSLGGILSGHIPSAP
ncbi:MAG: FAD-dependent oxidoreductase [Candidatus Omnitrophica bacterium]|nr:FAD-dependent oxidoreductase [Candidatus Omnitrophota bacterium]